eukprot:UN15467
MLSPLNENSNWGAECFPFAIENFVLNILIPGNLVNYGRFWRIVNY